MVRALRIFCLIGAPVMAVGCTGQIGAGVGASSGPSKPAKGSGGSGSDPGTQMPPGSDMPVPPPSIDPPSTISGGNTCMADKPGPRMLRRLTAEQLDNTVRDLFKSESAPRNDVFNDPQVLGFTGDANALLVRDLGSQQLMSYAEQVARWAVSTQLPTLSPCNQMTADCRTQFIQKFGARAFRQPVTAAQAARYEKLFATGATFEAGLELTLTAI